MAFYQEAYSIEQCSVIRVPPKCTACRRDPTKNMLNARSYITVYNMCLVSVTVESHSKHHIKAQIGTHAMVSNDVNWSMV